MIRHYVIAALRAMAANRLLSAISILGLAVGLTGAILMALVIRNQFTYDDFIPGHDRIYMGVTEGDAPGAPGFVMDRTHRLFAHLLQLNIPEIESAARLMVADQITGGDVVFSRGAVTGAEKIYWADPNVFDVLPLPLLHGDLATALHHPDGLVLPRTTARKYFGRDDVVGQILQLNGHPVMVRAVIEDLPVNGTELETGIFASINAPFLGFANYKPSPPGQFTPADIGVRTYFRLRPGASVATVQARIAALIKPIYPDKPMHMTMPLVRLDRVHLIDKMNADVMEGPNEGVTARLAIAALVGVLVLFIASLNFVNLTLARAARREREVGLRKVCGASRAELIGQFLGEAMIATALAALLAIALSEWLLPAVNAFMQTDARFDYGNDQLLIPALLLAIMAVGFVAGAYPAFVLSALKPATVLKGWTNKIADVGKVRSGLVILQFSILIVLAISAGVVWQQKNYAPRDALRVDSDQMLIVRIPGQGQPCPGAFKAEVRKLRGVRGVACSDADFLDSPSRLRLDVKGGYSPFLDLTSVDWGIFALYGIKPIAGPKALPRDYNPSAANVIVINKTAVKALGFASPQAAVGQSLPYTRGPADKDASILAVIPDFSLYPVTRPINPSVFTGHTKGGVFGSLLHIKLSGQRIPETLAAIDKVWSATGQTRPIDRFFLDQHMQDRYAGLLREAQMFAICAGLAVFLACLGLLGIAISTAERRTKEIGIRKSMGATKTQIVTMLLWQFSQPVLWASLIAWPVAAWAMQRWLSGFAYHVDLHAWLFIAASAAALVIALATVAGQAFLVARQKPVLALRYE